MEDLHKALRAVADSLVNRVNQNTETKYGPVAREEQGFVGLVESGDFEEVLISRLPGDQYARQKNIDGTVTLLVDTITIPEEVLFEHREKFLDVFAGQGGMAIGDRVGIGSSLNDSDVHTVYELNESRIPSNLLPVFEEALVLREVEKRKNLSRGTVYDWRGEIADSYSDRGNDPEHAQNLISLCSTGYFDEGEIFDEMYDEFVVEGDYSLQQFQERVGRYIKNNPFAVFVMADGMTKREVYYAATGKLDDIDRCEGWPSYVEICGKGDRTHQIIDKVRDQLEADENSYRMSTRHNREIRQKILKIEN